MGAHEELERAEAYALGALEAAERRDYEGHLATCHDCRRAVEKASIAALAMPLTADPVPVPAGSGDRLVALYRSGGGAPSEAPPGRGGAQGSGLALLMAAGTIAGVAFGGFWKNEADRQRGRAERSEAEARALAARVDDCQKERARERLASERLDRISLVLSDPDTRSLELEPREGARGAVQVAFSPTHGVAVIAKGLPEPPPGKVYKLWALEGGTPVPMETIDLAGTGPIHLEAPRADRTAAFAISLEKAGEVVTKPSVVVFLPKAG